MRHKLTNNQGLIRKFNENSSKVNEMIQENLTSIRCRWRSEKRAGKVQKTIRCFSRVSLLNPPLSLSYPLKKTVSCTLKTTFRLRCHNVVHLSPSTLVAPLQSVRLTTYYPNITCHVSQAQRKSQMVVWYLYIRIQIL